MAAAPHFEAAARDDVAAAPPSPLDAAAVLAARQRAGMNELRLTVTPLHRLVARCVMSPCTAVALIAALVCDVAGGGHAMWVVAGCLIIVGTALVLVVTWVAVRCVWLLLHCFVADGAVAYREERWVAVGAAQLVPGDYVHLAPGSVLLADCTLCTGALLTDTADLTGSTSPEAVADPDQLLLAGTAVVNGRGCAQVRYTGPETFVGQTVGLLGRLPHGYVHRQHLSRAYASVCLVAAVAAVTAEVVLVGVLRGWDAVPRAVMTCEAALFVLLCTPFGLDAATYLAVARGAAAAMSRAQAVVLRLGALHSLAAADVLLLDKTGTLSSGHCALAEPHRSFDAKHASRAALVQLVALACPWRRPSLHATRRAVLRCADLDACDEYTQLELVEHAHEHRSAALLRGPDGALLRITFGSVRSVLALPQDDAESAAACLEAQRLALAWARRGLRCVAVALADAGGPWRLAGLLTLSDPLREEAASVVADCDRLGLRVALVSGDDPRAVAAAAEAVGLATASVMTGRHVPPPVLLSRNAEGGQAEVTVDLTVAPASAAEYAECGAFAEMQPEHKASLVRVLQGVGHTVAFVGDGVNDAAAVQLADVGVALVGAEQQRTASRGALWGADVALTSNALTGLTELIVVSRELWGRVHAVFLCATTACLQTAVLIAALALVVMVPPIPDEPGWLSEAVGVPPSALQVPTLVLFGAAVLVWVATRPGDAAHWTRAPCRPHHAAALLQAAAMALVGVAGGVVLGVLANRLRRDRPPSPIVLLGDVDSFGDIASCYMLLLNVCLSITCASPARAGWRFVGQGRWLFVLVAGVWHVVRLFSALRCGPLFPVCLCAYVGLVAALQDVAKVCAHALCHWLEGRAVRRGAVPGSDGGAAAAGVPASSFDGTAPRRAAASAGDALVGCVASLDVRLLSRAPPAPPPSLD